MVIVAQFEPLDGVAERDIQRFITDDLRGNFEDYVSFSNLRIREYPRVLESDEQALEIATANSAMVVIWGTYDDEEIFVNINAGVAESLGGLAINRTELEEVTDIRLVMTDPLRESLAYNVVAVANAIFTATNKPLGVATTLTVLNAFGDVNPVPITGNSVAANWHRYVITYLSDTETSLDRISQAVDLSRNNPLTLMARGIAFQRTGQLDNALQDFSSAKRVLGADIAWTTPDYLIGNQRIYLENNLDGALEAYENVLKISPNDWFAMTVIGAVYQMKADRDTAYDYLQDAIANNPTDSQPYILAVPLAMRAGDLRLAQEYTNIILTEFSDPTSTARALEAVYSVQYSGFPVALSAYGNYTLGRFEQAIEDANKARQYPGFANSVELYLLEGGAYCNQQRYDQAKEAYTAGIELDETFSILYMLRAEAVFKKANTQPNAQETLQINTDLKTAREVSPSDEVTALIDSFEEGTTQVSCENFFDAELPQPSS